MNLPITSICIRLTYLIEALNKYEGSYILVSHDSYFVNQTANKIWEIEDYKIKEFVGTYDEWERWKQERKVAENESAKKKEIIPEKKNEQHAERKSNNNSSQNKNAQKELQRIQKHFQELEQKIENISKEKNTLEANLALPEIYLDSQKFMNAEKLYNQKNAELKKANAEYEKLFEKIMEMENEASQ